MHFVNLLTTNILFAKQLPLTYIIRKFVYFIINVTLELGKTDKNTET